MSIAALACMNPATREYFGEVSVARPAAVKVARQATRVALSSGPFSPYVATKYW